MDEFGWLYFVDRRGDTYRWKGENVSAAETEAAVAKAMAGAEVDVVAYGVKVRGKHMWTHFPPSPLRTIGT